jgi:hypothetical protein
MIDPKIIMIYVEEMHKNQLFSISPGSPGGIGTLNLQIMSHVMYHRANTAAKHKRLCLDNNCFSPKLM